jgi:hypothetical protein
LMHLGMPSIASSSAQGSRQESSGVNMTHYD